MAGVEYRHLHLTYRQVRGNDRRERGWRNDGVSFWVVDADGGASQWREVHAREGGYEGPYTDPGPEVRQAFVAFLNELGSEGWRVVSYSTLRPGGFGPLWPFDDFLLARES